MNYEKQIDEWTAMGEALGLRSLSISMDGFDPDKVISDTMIDLNNAGYRFRSIRIPAGSTYGEAVQAMDNVIHATNPDACSFLELMRKTGQHGGVTYVTVFIGS